MNKQFSLFEGELERIASRVFRFSNEADFDAAVAQSTRKHGKPRKPKKGFKGYCSFGTEGKKTELLLLWRPAPPYQDAKIEYWEVKEHNYEVVRRWLLEADYRIKEGPTLDPELEDSKQGLWQQETTRVLFEDANANQLGIIINPPWPRFTKRRQSTFLGKKLLLFLAGLAAGSALSAALAGKNGNRGASTQ